MNFVATVTVRILVDNIVSHKPTFFLHFVPFIIFYIQKTEQKSESVEFFTSFQTIISQETLTNVSKNDIIINTAETIISFYCFQKSC